MFAFNHAKPNHSDYLKAEMKAELRIMLAHFAITVSVVLVSAVILTDFGGAWSSLIG